MRTLISLILNIIWLLTAGRALFRGSVGAGVLSFFLIVTTPLGLPSFRLAGFVVWPFGREVVDTGRGGAVGAIGNVIWFVIAGWSLAIGHVLTALAQAITIVGIPLAWANVKLIPVTCFPFGQEVIGPDAARSRMLHTPRRD